MSVVRVLGPVDVVADDGSVHQSGSALRRTLLALLAIHRGQVLSPGWLMEHVWGDDQPESGVRALRFHVSQLRKECGEMVAVETRPGGYQLDLPAASFDAGILEELAGQARVEPDDRRSVELCEQALMLWRGEPFVDAAPCPTLDHEAGRLDELRLAVTEYAFVRRLAAGAAGELISDLTQLVNEHPLREGLWSSLITAQYRAGQQAKALATYERLRTTLTESLGLDPSPQLQELQMRVLQHDPDLATVTTPASEAPADARPRPRGIPAALSSFVGRSDELAEVQEWLSAARLVSLCGFGGLGKTRLAHEAARAMNHRFADGVWYVELNPIADPAVLADTIVAAGGHAVPRDRDPVDHLLALLADREVLIVLDSCEHLVDHVAEIATGIVREAPHARVLATSRVQLGVPGEAIFAVRPLDHRSATELFTDRAALAGPGITVDDTNRPTLHRLCERLDGIPLAIEMAAARLAVMSLDQLVEALDDRLELLTDARRAPDTRQRSLTAVMDWSYQLLDLTDRQLLRRMSVCVGGFDLDAAVHIGAPEPAPSLTDVVDRLERLVHASLVIADTHHEPPRYRILEPVRQYGTSQLGPDEHHQTAHAHAHHYATVAITIFDLVNSDQFTAFETGEREVGNMRAAMSWCYCNDYPRLGLSIAHHGSYYLFGSQMYREVLRWIQTGLDLVDDDDDDTVAAAVIASFAARNLADLDAHRAVFERVQRGFDSVSDPRLRAELLSARSSSVLDTDPRAAEADTREAIDMRVSTPQRMWALLNNRIDQSWLSGDLHDGPTLLQRIGEVHDEMLRSDPADTKINAGVAACEGRWDDVVRLTAGADRTSPMADASRHTLRAEALAVLGRHDEALAVLATIDPDTYERHRRYTDRVHASIDLRRREPRPAAERLTALADEIARDGRRLAAGMHVASLLAVAAHDLDQHETAATLFGYAASEQRRLDIVLRPSDRPLAERATAGCQRELGAERYGDLAAQGASSGWHDLPTVKLDEISS
jgi:predicted ATPase/DNA-binding SARP family transcriptional activator